MNGLQGMIQKKMFGKKVKNKTMKKELAKKSA